MRSLNSQVFRALVLGFGLLAFSGCSAPGILKSKKVKIPKADASNPAVRVLCIWEPSEGRGVDGLPTRGFAGQVIFLTRQKSTPVQVDGAVRIYLFDDQGPAEDQAKPLHQFDFQGDAWTMHLHNGTLGPSYHVFIPYMRKGNFQTQAALRLRMKPTVGPVIYSDMVNVTLPGAIIKKTPQSNSAEKSVDLRPVTSTIHPRRSAVPNLADDKSVTPTADARINRKSYTLGTVSRPADVAPRAATLAGTFAAESRVRTDGVQPAALSGSDFQQFMNSQDGLSRTAPTHHKRRFKLTSAGSFGETDAPYRAAPERAASECFGHPLAGVEDPASNRASFQHPLANGNIDEPTFHANRREPVLEFDDFFKTPTE